MKKSIMSKTMSIFAVILSLLMAAQIPAGAIDAAVAASVSSVGESSESAGSSSENISDEQPSVNNDNEASSSDENSDDDALRYPMTDNTEQDINGKQVSEDKYSKTYQTGIDTYQTVCSLLPNYFENSDGKKTDYDNDLEKKEKIFSDDYYSGKSTDVKVKLPENIKDGKGISFEYNGVQITMIPDDGNWDRSAVKENAILYNDVYENTDVQYTLYQYGLKQDIILRSFTGRTEYSYTLDTHGDKAVADNNAVNIYKDNNNEPAYTIEAPSMSDSAGDVSDNIKLTIKNNDDGKYTVTIKADKDWLSDTKRVYPVYIDPDVTTYDSSKMRMCTVDSGRSKSVYPAHAYGYAGYMTDDNVGMPGTGDFGYTRMLYDFSDIKSDIPSGADIKSAYLNVYQYTDLGSSAAHPSAVFECRRLTGAWDATDLTWGKAVTLTGEGTSENFTSASGIGMHSFDMTDTVNAWANGVSGQYGVVIKAKDDNMQGAAFFTPYSFIGQNSFSEDKHQRYCPKAENSHTVTMFRED